MSHPLLNAFWTMLWFFLWIMWFTPLFPIIVDGFREDPLKINTAGGRSRRPRRSACP